MPRIRQDSLSPPHSLPALLRGTTLLEILISLLIVAIGLLGIVSLQTASLRYSQSAYLRSQATVLASDMLERVLANQHGVVLGAYEGQTGALSSSCTTPSGCDAAVMAGNDIAEWQSALQQDLPEGAGVVCVDATPEDGTPQANECDEPGGGTASAYAVKVWWDDDRDAVAERRITLSFRP
ncbi:MAG: type IV pilus modification protein PilV [Pseudomonadota bacterium]